MAGLFDIIRDVVRAEGPMSVARYMELALQHPTYGYYRHADRLGEAGDFITAPEISQMFGELIGLWCAEAWRSIGCPPSFTFLELGPGRGTLMQDALRATRKVDGFHQAMRLHLLESNATFRAKQMEKLAVYRPTYLDDIGRLPDGPLIVVANEFFDAMPIHQLLKREMEGSVLWSERKIGVKEDLLVFVADPPVVDGKVLVREASPVTVSLVQILSRLIASRGGAALIIDYGYTQSSGFSTLQAVAGHRPQDPLVNPGEADLTAHVDFSALQEKALEQGADVLGPVTQGAFLQAMGIDIRASLLQKKATPEQAAALDQAVHRLTDESQMGSLFKAMAIVSKSLRDLPGFD